MIKRSSNLKPKSTNKEMTVSEAGAKGGRKTLSTHRHEHYQEIGRMGGKKKTLLNAASSSIAKSAKKAATNGLSSMKVLKKPKAKSA